MRATVASHSKASSASVVPRFFGLSLVVLRAPVHRPSPRTLAPQQQQRNQQRSDGTRTAAVAIADAEAAVSARPAGPTKEVLRSTTHEAGLKVEVLKVTDGRTGDAFFEVNLQADPVRPMVLHWALDDWKEPAQSLWPPHTQPQGGGGAVQTPFSGDGRLRLNFAEAQCPERIMFVLKVTPHNEETKWVNDSGTDFIVHLKPPGLDALVGKVIAAEATWTHFSLYQRFCLVMEVLDAAEAAGPEGMALVYVWLRMSHQRLLDWYRKSNYQSKDIAHVQKSLAQRMSAKARSCKDPQSRMFARMAMAGLPRGGGNGDDIRMGILHIMRSYGIREGHRPGIEERFLEQWHQKLHTNTTPDDVAICEAYLAFQHSGNMDDFWRVLWDVGKLSREDLARFTHPITAQPLHLPHLIDAFKGYRWTLMITHSGANLDTAAHMAQGAMDDDLKYQVLDLLAHRNEWWVPGKIVEIRQRLAGIWKAQDTTRDVLLLDLALDGWFRILVERMDMSALKGDDLLDLVALTVRNELVAVDSEDLSMALNQWHWMLAGAGGGAESQRWQQPWAMQALAALQRMELSLASHMDSLYNLVQPHAEMFGDKCKIDPKFITTFGEEVVRGQSLFCLSPMLKHLEPMLRSAAGVAPWQVVSTGGAAAAMGVLLSVSSLEEVQGQVFTRPTLLLAERMGGNEDIPQNVQAVITRSATDVLSHAAIRARAQQVLLATCFDEHAWDTLQGMAAAGGNEVPFTLTLTPEGHVVGDLAPEGAQAADPLGAASSASASWLTDALTEPKVQLQQPTGTDRWVIDESEFAPGLVGAKSLNCSLLAKHKASGALPAEISVPHSLALPLGTFERVLADPCNAEVASELQAVLDRLADAVHTAAAEAASHGSNGGASPLQGVFQVLGELRSLVATGLQAPAELRLELSSLAAASGMIPAPEAWSGAAAWGSAWSAICKVWASKWNDRAWLSRRALGVPEHHLYMGVLLQQVVPADHAFVLHTAHPLKHAPGHIVGEVVPGMGEVLVGNHPGRALSFSSEPAADQHHAPSILISSLPSKRSALKVVRSGAVPLLIARSDANGEDLGNMAGAGLYDSVPMVPLQEVHVDATHEPLIADPGFRTHLLSRLVDLGRHVRSAFDGVEQDVEGVVSGGAVWVVQSRPQVLAQHHQ